MQEQNATFEAFLIGFDHVYATLVVVVVLVEYIFGKKKSVR
jgi:hypothetical protein